MDNQDLRTLKILEEIERNDASSQRELAKKLDVSLGLVNSFVKRLAHKGFFKIKNIPRNRIKYILTPKGAAEKTRLTYLYIQHSLDFYKTARQKLRKLFQGFINQGVSRVVFYGATDLSEIAYLSLKETPLELVAVVDPKKVGRKKIWGSVQHPKELSILNYDKILIAIPGKEDDIYQKLIVEGISEKKIVRL